LLDMSNYSTYGDGVVDRQHDRDAAVNALSEWAENQARARPRLVAAAWRAGAHNVAELARAARVQRDTIYADLRAQRIDYRDRRPEYEPIVGGQYGLPTAWVGERRIAGGHGIRAGGQRRHLARRRDRTPVRWEGLSLAHLAPDGGQLIVESQHRRGDPAGAQQVIETQTLNSLALAINMTAVATGGDSNPDLAADLAAGLATGERAWESIELPVDGARTPFRSVNTGHHWAAYGSVEVATHSTDIIVTAVDFPRPNVVLVAIADLAAYRNRLS